MDTTLACLAAWMPRQRWYAAKGRLPSLRIVAWWQFEPRADDPDATARTYLVADEGVLPHVLYQVPVVSRATATLAADSDHIIGSPEPGTTLVDGPFDRAYAQGLLALMREGRTVRGHASTATGAPHDDLGGSAYDSTVLSGEQSNTSLVYRPREHGISVICKIYRQVHPGLNPDIELASALAASSSPHVPRFVGSVRGTWSDDTSTDGQVTGSLAFAQEFLPGVEDAWRVALRAAANGEEFRERAAELGRATAEVHEALATLFPTHEAGQSEREQVETGWRRRLAIAIAEVPAIADLRDAVESVYARAADASWPRVQRIHGDYHLGQLLDVPHHGWVLLDFEGEPLRPMRERTQPDLALRDVAGMLRSFDYVAGSLRLHDPDGSPQGAAAWVESARGGFVAGYARAAGADLEAAEPLLTALELDKAVYEAIYESRNRPGWVTIPLAAITRLTAPAH